MCRCVPFAALVAALLPACLVSAYLSFRQMQVNLDEILTNDQLIQYYCQCLMDTGICDEKGEHIKRLFIEAIHNDCASCNDIQKAGAIRGITFLINQRPQIWNQLMSKYDPQGTFPLKHPEFFS